MGLKATVETLEGLDESLHTLYKQTDEGLYKLDVEGLDDNSGLKSALQKERESAREAQRQLKEMQKRFDGIDPDETKELLSKINQSEEARLIAEGKIDDVMKSRTERMKAEYEARMQELENKANSAMERAKKRDQQVLENQIRQAASEIGVHKHAYEDVLLRATRVFSLSDADEAIALGADGQPVFGKDGSSPLSPKEWLESLKESAPHLFPAQASGTGAGANSTVNGANYRRAKMTPAEKASYISKHGQEAYLKLPM